MLQLLLSTGLYTWQVFVREANICQNVDRLQHFVYTHLRCSRIRRIMLFILRVKFLRYLRFAFLFFSFLKNFQFISTRKIETYTRCQIYPFFYRKVIALIRMKSPLHRKVNVS